MTYFSHHRVSLSRTYSKGNKTRNLKERQQTTLDSAWTSPEFDLVSSTSLQLSGSVTVPWWLNQLIKVHHKNGSCTDKACLNDIQVRYVPVM